jgi:hypothetical protein
MKSFRVRLKSKYSGLWEIIHQWKPRTSDRDLRTKHKDERRIQYSQGRKEERWRHTWE